MTTKLGLAMGEQTLRVKLKDGFYFGYDVAVSKTPGGLVAKEHRCGLDGAVVEIPRIDALRLIRNGNAVRVPEGTVANKAPAAVRPVPDDSEDQETNGDPEAGRAVGRAD